LEKRFHSALAPDRGYLLHLSTKDPTGPSSVLQYEKTLSNIQEVSARSGRAIAIEGDEEIKHLVEHTVQIPKPPNYSHQSSK
jgi:glutamine---fructose-6-phosphate transaminase (isomerizing)